MLINYIMESLSVIFSFSKYLVGNIIAKVKRLMFKSYSVSFACQFLSSFQCFQVLDECLRAISGFKGTEDLLDDNLLDSPFTLDCIRMKKVSSAPSYELKNLDETIDSPEDVCAGIKQWCEVIEKHLPRSLVHTSAMVDNTFPYLFKCFIIFENITKHCSIKP